MAKGKRGDKRPKPTRPPRPKGWNIMSTDGMRLPTDEEMKALRDTPQYKTSVKRAESKSRRAGPTSSGSDS